MHLLVDFASERELGGLKSKFEEGTNVLHCEASPIRKGGVIQQSLTGHLNGTSGRNLGEEGDHIE